MPIEGFDYKEFARNLAEQVGPALPPDILEADRNYIVNIVYNFCFMAGEAVFNDTNLNFNDASNELKNESETLNENYSNNFTDVHKINYEESYIELKSDKILKFDNISDNYDNKPENNYKDNIKSINPGSIVKVYDYKEI